MTGKVSLLFLCELKFAGFAWNRISAFRIRNVILCGGPKPTGKMRYTKKWRECRGCGRWKVKRSQRQQHFPIYTLSTRYVSTVCPMRWYLE